MCSHPTAPALVFGALNLDLCGTPAGPVRMHDSNPGTVRLSAGGVGHNIARHLAAHIPVELVTLLADDAQADLLRPWCAREGIGLQYAREAAGASGSYLSVQDETGDLTIAVSDMTLIDSFLPDRLGPLAAAIRAAPLVVADANLPPQTLLALAGMTGCPSLLDPVSGFKALRARAAIGRFTAVKPNQLEAVQLTGETDMDRAADALLGMGVRRVFISLGGGGVLAADAGGHTRVSAPRMHAISTNGAGDAMAAGIARGLALGLGTRACAALGIESARDHLLNQGGRLI